MASAPVHETHVPIVAAYASRVSGSQCLRSSTSSKKSSRHPSGNARFATSSISSRRSAAARVAFASDAETSGAVGGHRNAASAVLRAPRASSSISGAGGMPARRTPGACASDAIFASTRSGSSFTTEAIVGRAASVAANAPGARVERNAPAVSPACRSVTPAPAPSSGSGSSSGSGTSPSGNKGSLSRIKKVVDAVDAPPNAGVALLAVPNPNRLAPRDESGAPRVLRARDGTCSSLSVSSAAETATRAASAAATSEALLTSSGSHADAHVCPIIASRITAHVSRSWGIPASICVYARCSTKSIAVFSRPSVGFVAFSFASASASEETSVSAEASAASSASVSSERARASSAFARASASVTVAA